MGDQVSRVCEYGPNACNEPSVLAYPAMNGRWFALCRTHARGHEDYSAPVQAICDGRITREGFLLRYRQRTAPDPSGFIERRRYIVQHAEEIAARTGLAISTVRAYASIPGKQARLLNRRIPPAAPSPATEEPSNG